MPVSLFDIPIMFATLLNFLAYFLIDLSQYLFIIYIPSQLTFHGWLHAFLISRNRKFNEIPIVSFGLCVLLLVWEVFSIKINTTFLYILLIFMYWIRFCLWLEIELINCFHMDDGVSLHSKTFHLFIIDLIVPYV